MSALAAYAVTAAFAGASPQPSAGNLHEPPRGATEVASPTTPPASNSSASGSLTGDTTRTIDEPTTVDSTPAENETPTNAKSARSTVELTTPTGVLPPPAFHQSSAELLQRRHADARRGRILTIAGATLTGIGLAGRIGLDVFLATVADLSPREPYGRWSVGSFFMATTFTNVPTLVGLGLLGGGSYHSARAHGRRFAHRSSRRNKRWAWGLIGGGVGLWGLSRALFLPWTRLCQSNACAYGYLEPTYFVSAGLVISGVVIAARESGFERAEAEEKADYIKLESRRQGPTLTPVIAPGFQGLRLTGRF
ncbi:MAG TPA: hypothetical protein ENJ18_17890 [Nannocystis exedens]|nr:hypothetical protein [Nannocystis exedens]